MARRLFLLLLVAASACGCVTQWQRDQDAMAARIEALRDLQSSDMQRRIDEARALR